MIALLEFLGVGILTGILSSMFGFGGGLIVIPVLYWLLPSHDIPDTLLMHVAVATSLAIMIINSTNSTLSHHRKKNIIWPIFWKLAPGIAVGAFIGGLVSHFFDDAILRYLFIIFVLYTIISSFVKKSFIQVNSEPIKLPGPVMNSVVGGVIGIIATLLGIGGSVFTVPYLRKCRLKMLNAVALATPLSLPIALIGSGSNLFTGLTQSSLPASCFGYIFLPAFFGIGIGGFIGVPIGVRLAQRLPDQIFSKVYLGLLVLVAISMVI
ncbi:putative membrane protein YfcA [Pullulanibacillus pueri]|uniref:Probable membrane transporter protein n=1 Tax=Pullulanibacillus pueri TaxID=1437324 RepID=A0A8J3EKJ9_9BACL|nr:sulfite exporter TauE/SafE family protein [Pullulanibacillus pueri]MBM7681347.1 putative membrane protein YfcA [Pullulanibacillus pueri]GGH77503.1 UPF0721 transmembrane protein [Pullulanibacillus pueri]